MSDALPDRSDPEPAELLARRLADLQEELRHSRETLQATVEELETANDELRTVNAEYARHIQQLELNNDIDNTLRSTDVGTLLLDDQLTVRTFTPAVAKYVRQLDRDVGRSIEDLARDSDR